MADRVHPRADSSPQSSTADDSAAKMSSITTTASAVAAEGPTKPTQPPPQKPVPTPGTYVIQIPKDQIYRYPPPENSRRYQNYTSKKPRRSCFCRCLCFTLALALILVILLGIAAGVLYFIFRPEAPKYTVDAIAIKGMNLTSVAPISPEFDVTVRAQNPNDKIGIYYEGGSSVRIFYSGVNLCNGVLPEFYQPSNNLTVFQTALKGSNIRLASGVHSSLVTEQREGKVPLRLNLKAPVKIKVGAVKTWTITVKVNCDVTVDKLTADSKILVKDCDYGVKLW